MEAITNKLEGAGFIVLDSKQKLFDVLNTLSLIESLNLPESAFVEEAE